MRKKLKSVSLLLFALVSMILTSCGDDADTTNGNTTSPENEEISGAHDFAVSGAVEKGPFVSGSTINMQPMNKFMKSVGSMYSTVIADNDGSFDFQSERFEEPYARLQVSGYFYNECTAELSKSPITLMGVAKLADKKSVNVNILTHLKYQRIMRLLDGTDKTFEDANEQAQKELLTQFGLQRYIDTDASQFSITAGTDESAALVAVSALLLYGKTEAQFTEYLQNISMDFAGDGEFGETSKKQMNEDKIDIKKDLPRIRMYIIERYQEMGKEITLDKLENYIDWDNDGVAGENTSARLVTLSLDKGFLLPMPNDEYELYIPAEGGTYEIKMSSDKYDISNVKWEVANFYGNTDSNISSAYEYYFPYGNNDQYHTDRTIWTGGSDNSFHISYANGILTINVEGYNGAYTRVPSWIFTDSSGNKLFTLTAVQGASNKDPNNKVNYFKRICNTIRRLYSVCFSQLEQIWNTGPKYSEDQLLNDTWRISFNFLRFLARNEERDDLMFNYSSRLFRALIYNELITLWENVPYPIGITDYAPTKCETAQEIRGKLIDDLKSFSFDDNEVGFEYWVKFYEENNHDEYVDLWDLEALRCATLSLLYMNQKDWQQAKNCIKDFVYMNANESVPVYSSRGGDERWISEDDLKLLCFECDFMLSGKSTTEIGNYLKQYVEGARNIPNGYYHSLINSYIGYLRRHSLATGEMWTYPIPYCAPQLEQN